MRSTKYDKKTLEPIVRTSRSLAEVMRRLGITPNGGNYRYIGARVRHAELDTSHFRQQTIARRCAAVPERQLRKLVRKSTSFAQMAIALGLQPNGRDHHEIKRRIVALQLDTSHFKGRGWSRDETTETHPSVRLVMTKLRVSNEEVFVENSRYIYSQLIGVRLVERGWEYRCVICRLLNWRGKKLVLHVDHINGIANDNRLENLRFLCPNCHSQTDTYCRRRR